MKTRKLLITMVILMIMVTLLGSKPVEAEYPGRYKICTPKAPVHVREENYTAEEWERMWNREPEYEYIHGYPNIPAYQHCIEVRELEKKGHVIATRITGFLDQNRRFPGIDIAFEANLSTPITDIYGNRINNFYQLSRSYVILYVERIPYSEGRAKVIRAIKLDQPFESYNISTWALESMDNLLLNSLMSNFSLLVSPQTAITREQFTEIMVNVYDALGGAQPGFAYTPFVDTNNPSIIKAHTLGIIKGVSDIKFEPNRTITREEIAAILFRTMKLLDVNIPITSEAITFKDQHAISDWARQAVETMYKLKVIQGTSDLTITPKAKTSVEQAITLIERFYSLIVEHKV